MGYFQVRYDSRVVNYDRRGFIGLATDVRRSEIKILLCANEAYLVGSRITSKRFINGIKVSSASCSGKTKQEAEA